MRQKMLLLPMFLLLGIIASCNQTPPQISQQLPQAESTTMLDYLDPDRGITFKYPSEWSVEEIAQSNLKGILLTNPSVEAGWQANMFVELRLDSGGRSAEDIINDVLPSFCPKSGS